MLSLLSIIIWVGCLICWIIVLIKQFQIGGVVHGIIGLICQIWAFIWGWMNAERAGLKRVMLIWTVLLIIGIVLGIAGGGFYAYRTT